MIALAFLFSCTPRPATDKLRNMTFEVQYRLILDQTGFHRIWIPIPETNKNQTISRLEIHTGLRMYLGRDTFYGNKFVIIEDQVQAPDTVTIAFRCERRKAVPRSEDLDDARKQFYLSSSHAEPKDDLWDLVCDSLDAEQEAFQYRLYNFLISSMTPTEKSSSDIMEAYRSGQGSAREYAGLFAAISRTKGIPARYMAGVWIPERPEGRIKRETAWNEFFLPQKGWVPVDLFKAEQDIRNANDYFGSLDSRRILFSIGRDIILPNGSRQDVVDHIVFPYVKVNGKVLARTNTVIVYREIEE